MWSVELPTASSRFLAESYPSPTRPADATKINDRIGYDGSGATSAAGANRAFRGQKSSSYNILSGKGGPYSSHWDSVNGEWWLSYGTTGWETWAQTVVRYQASRDEFRHWQAASIGDTATALWNPYGQAHNFGMSCIDPVGRRFYRMLRTDTYGQTQPDGGVSPNGYYILCWINIDNPTQRGVIPQWVPGSGNHLPIEYFPNLGGPAGSVVCFHFNAGTTRQWYRYDCGTGQYVYDLPNVLHGRRPPIAYCNGAIYGVNPSTSISPTGGMWRLNANKTFEYLTPPPVLMNAEANGTVTDNDNLHTEFAALGTNIYAFRVEDPAVGEGYVYKFDTLANGGMGSWTLVDRMAQGLMGATLGGTSFSVAPVPELGVIVMAHSIPTDQDVAVIWKP